MPLLVGSPQALSIMHLTEMLYERKLIQKNPEIPKANTRVRIMNLFTQYSVLFF